MEKSRTFPRYKLNSVLAWGHIPTQEAEFKTVDLSLGGLRFSCHQKIFLDEKEKCFLEIKGQQFSLYISPIWERPISREEYEYGVKVYFTLKTDFQRWFLLIKAFHNIQLKRSE